MSHQIEEVTAYRFRGKLYDTKERAEEAAEELVTLEIKQAMLDKGFTVSEWVQVCQIILDHRVRLSALLDY